MAQHICETFRDDLVVIKLLNKYHITTRYEDRLLWRWLIVDCRDMTVGELRSHIT